MTDEVRMVDWYEGDVVEYFDDLVEKLEAKNDVTLNAGYLETFTAIHITDWKYTVGRWLSDLIDDLMSLQEEIEETPDNEDEQVEITIVERKPIVVMLDHPDLARGES